MKPVQLTPDPLDPTKYALEPRVAEWFQRHVEIEQREPHFVFRVDEHKIGNWNDFLAWMQHSRAPFSLAIGGGLYPFRTPDEAMHFALGFQLGWEIFRG